MSNDPKPFGDNFIPVIFVDRLIHTKLTPYCSDNTCPCHNEREREAVVFATITAEEGVQALTYCKVLGGGRP